MKNDKYYHGSAVELGIHVKTQPNGKKVMRVTLAIYEQGA